MIPLFSPILELTPLNNPLAVGSPINFIFEILPFNPNLYIRDEIPGELSVVIWAKEDLVVITTTDKAKIKTKEIILEALLNINTRGFDQMQKIVDDMVVSGKHHKDNLKNFLDKNWELGGLNMDKRTAKKLASKIKQLVDLRRSVSGSRAKTVLAQAEQIKNILLPMYGVKLNERQKDIFDELLARRLSKQIDDKEMYFVLTSRHKNSGLGLASVLAKKIIKKIELLILEQL